VLEKAGLKVDDEMLVKVAPLVQPRIKSLNDVIEVAGFFFDEDFQAPEADMLIQSKMDAASTKAALEASYALLSRLEDFSHDAQYVAMKELAKELRLKNGQLFGAVRVAVSGQEVSTPTFETMEVLGKKESLARIQMAIASLDHVLENTGST
jgi:glutamyl-tRNA synthetase